MDKEKSRIENRLSVAMTTQKDSIWNQGQYDSIRIIIKLLDYAYILCLETHYLGSFQIHCFMWFEQQMKKQYEKEKPMINRLID